VTLSTVLRVGVTCWDDSRRLAVVAALAVAVDLLVLGLLHVVGHPQTALGHANSLMIPKLLHTQAPERTQP
jgi:hypothetical protein